MPRSRVRRLLLFTIAFCHVLLAFVVASPALAQDNDRVPPSITFEPLDEGLRGDTQVFSARVSDEESAVERVTLHFRAAGDEEYEAREMTLLAGTDIYSISIDDIDPEATAVEYYIDTSDVAGNRSIEGFAFDPLVRVLSEQVAPIAEAAEDPATAPVAVPAADGLSTRQKILYGVLGVVAVGAIAAAAGGSGGGGGSGGSGTDTPVTVVADPL